MEKNSLPKIRLDRRKSKMSRPLLTIPKMKGLKVMTMWWSLKNQNRFKI
jgi:hypothetical protein